MTGRHRDTARRWAFDPFAAHKLGRVGTPGRPLGAASARDRVSEPPIYEARRGLKVVPDELEPPQVERRS